MCIFRWQTILTRVLPPSQKTIYNFKLVVGHTTKHMKYGRSCDMEIWLPSVENVALGRGFIIFQCPLTTVHDLYNISYSTVRWLTSKLLKLSFLLIRDTGVLQLASNLCEKSHFQRSNVRCITSIVTKGHAETMQFDEVAQNSPHFYDRWLFSFF